MRFRKLISASLLVLASIAATVLACELALRLVLNPVDYLKPYLVSDPILGHKIAPGSSYHDSLGFRNARVPDRVDIVAIGDSMTYGNQALARDAWPAVLERMTGKTVYNMGLSGYGPLQYYYLLTRLCERFNPNTVMVGVYLGNDISDAYEMGVNNAYWSDVLAGKQATTVTVPAKSSVIDNNSDGLLVDILMHHSILFRMALESALGRVIRLVKNALHGHDLGVVNFKEGEDSRIVYIPSHGENIAIDENFCFRSVNLEDPRIVKGVEITKQVLLMMRVYCAKRGVKLVAVIIPTKETVYSPLFDQAKVTGVLRRTVQFEGEIKADLEQYLAAHDIAHVDSTPCLRDKLATVNPYPLDTENHPNSIGYDAIAACAAKGLSAP